MTGKHREAGLLARYPRLSRWLAPGAAAAGALLIILLAGFAIWGLPGSANGNPSDTAARSALDRGSRDDNRSGSPSPTASPSSASPSALPSASASPAPIVVSTGTCKATFYGTGTGTASGEKFNPNAMTAAHKTLPFGTRVRVTNLANGKQVTVRINDRGPYGAGRCLDLTTAAFKMIGSTSTGVLNVRYEVLKS